MLNQCEWCRSIGKWFQSNLGTKDGLSSASVRAITEDADGLIYVATTEGIVTIDQNMDVTALKTIELKTNIFVIFDVADGLIYGLTQSSNLFTLKQGAVETFLNHEESTVTGAIGVLPTIVIGICISGNR